MRIDNKCRRFMKNTNLYEYIHALSLKDPLHLYSNKEIYLFAEIK